jgi:hypothetical protein
MTIIDELTPTQYSIGRGRMLVRGKTLETIEFLLQVTLYNANNKILDSKYISLSFTDPEKQTFINKVQQAITDLENQTGLTEYVEPV